MSPTQTTEALLSQWRDEDWINPNAPKTYPKSDTPPVVLAKRESVLTIPKQYFDTMQSLTVSALLRTTLPSVRGNIVLKSPESLFSNKEPNETDLGKLIQSRDVPSLAITDQALAAFGQAWFNGAKSVLDYKYRDSRLPLWFLSHWRNIAVAHKTLGVWTEAELWTKRQTKQLKNKTQAEIDEISEKSAQVFVIFDALAPSGPLAGLGSAGTVTQLTGLLGIHWLSDTIIDAMAFVLDARVARTPKIRDTAVFASVDLGRHLPEIAAAQKEIQRATTEVLDRYERMIIKKVRYLLIPLNINNEHWVAVCVDFETKTWRYGDSFGPKNSRPERALKGLERWLRKLGGRFVEGERIKIGDQTDGFSCGLCMMNALERVVWPETRLWTSGTREAIRMNWFVVLAREHMRTVKEFDAVGAFQTAQEDDIEEVKKNRVPTLPADFKAPDKPSHSGRKDLQLNDSVSLPPPPQFATECTLDRDPSLSPPHNTGSSSQRRVSPSPKFTYMASDAYGGEEPVQTDVSMASSDGIATDGRSGMSCDDPWRSSEASEMEIEKTQDPSFDWASSSETNLSDISLNPIHRPKPVALKGFRAPPRLSIKAKGPVQHDQSGSVGISKTAQRNTKEKAQEKAGTLVIDTVKMRRFMEKLRQDDPLVQRPPTDNTGRAVRHSVCGKTILMANIYQTKTWNEHVEKCKRRHRTKGYPAANTRPLEAFFKPLGASNIEKVQVQVAQDKETHLGGNAPGDEPQFGICGGLSETTEGLQEETLAKLTRYLGRETSKGGGGLSKEVNAQKLFQREYASCTTAQKEEIRQANITQWKWHVHYPGDSKPFVQSTECKGVAKRNGPGKPGICERCFGLLTIQSFQSALNYSGPKKEENLKFTNNEYKNKRLAHGYAKSIGILSLLQAAEETKTPPCLKYVLGVLDGKYIDQPVFTGLVEAVVERQSREDRKTGLQNMKYSPAYDQFAHSLLLSSPQAYRVLKDSFPVRSERNFRTHRSKLPKFPMGIGEENAILARNHLDGIGYNGPVALACDDTKLFPALRTYHDPVCKKWYLLGMTDGAKEIADIESLEEILATSRIEKATKLRLWCLQVPLPGVPPLIIAALPISSKLKAPDLLVWSRDLIRELRKQGVKVISYSCDGSEVERSVLKLLASECQETRKHKIPHPVPGFPDLEFDVGQFDGLPLALLQDSKHALKTARNNLFSGARLLTLFGYVAHYGQVRPLGFDGPLFRRDVENVDKQDDRAALRLTSADSLRYLVEKDSHAQSVGQPRLLGSIVYLFVLGELVDAYQNRHLPHFSRVVMASRAMFFLEMWKLYLKTAGYDTSRHFISREAYDIFQYLARGIIVLIIIHGEYLEGDPVPLLPWLHSSEPVEHTFGEARQQKKEFCFADFMYMVPKLSVQHKTTFARAYSGDARITAGGYFHTYFDNRDLDIQELSRFPSLKDIADACKVGYNEAETLVAMLGVVPDTFYHPPSAQPAIHLPPISMWYSTAEDSPDEDSESDCGTSSEDALTYAEVLEDQLGVAGRRDMVLSDTDEREILAFTCAVAALDVEETSRIMSMPDYSEEDLRDDANTIHSTLSMAIIPMDLNHEEMQYSGFGQGDHEDLDLTSLIEIRRLSQTKAAAESIKKKGQSSESEPFRFGDSKETPTLTARQQLVRKMNQTLLKYDEGKGVTTGLNRKVLWLELASKDAPAMTGNVANAATVNKAAATRVITKRRNAFKQYFQGSNLEGLATGDIGPFKPLSPGSWGLGVVDGVLRLVQVLAVYSKGSSKSAKHEWVLDSTQLGAVSYIAVQAYEKAFRNSFTAMTGKTLTYQVRKFQHLPASRFLLAIPATAPKRTKQGLVELPVEWLNQYNTINFRMEDVKKVIGVLEARKKRKGGAAAVEEDADDEESENEADGPP